MNRNRYKKVVALATATTVTVASLTGCQSSTNTVSSTATEASNAATTKKTSTTTKSVQDGVEKKTETVFAKADAAGSVNDITVSSWLKNGKGSSTIADITDLTNIKNVKGEEAFSQNGTALDWTANGSDIYYQGKTTKALPVTVKVTYTLDGVEVKPEELAGKSGHVKMRFDYTNNQKMTVDVNGKMQEVNVPFAIMTGTILKNEKFSNITVTNGQVINDGNRTVVAGFSLPGLKDSLFNDVDSEYKDKVDDIDIPSYVEVEADATDFQVDMTLSVVLNDFFNEINTDDFNKADDIKSKVNEMKDRFNEIVTGSGDLDKAMEELQKGGLKLDDGAGQLASGVSKLTDNNSKLNSGAKALMGGLASAKNGGKDLSAGLGKLSAGATKLSKGINGMFVGDESLPVLKAGTDYLVAGFDKVQEGNEKTLLAGAQELEDETQGIDKVVNGTMEKIGEKVPGLMEKELTVANMKKVTAVIEGALSEEYIASIQKDIMTEVSTQFSTKATELLGAQKAAMAKKLRIDSKALTDEKMEEMLKEAQTELVTGSGNAQSRGAQLEVFGAIQQYKGAATAVQAVGATLGKGLNDTQITYYKNKISKKIESDLETKTGTQIKKALQPVIKEITKTMMAEINQSDEMKAANVQLKKLKDGCKDINGGIKDLYAGSKKIQAGTSKLEKGIRTELKPGANELAAGAANANAGGATLYSGLKQLSTGSIDLSQGITAYTAGAGTLQTGIMQLKSGTASAVSGIGQIKDGTHKLSDGTKEFQDKAINKIADAVDKNFDQVKDKLTAVVKAGQSYNNFTGLNSEMNGSVKFVIETAAIGDSDK